MQQLVADLRDEAARLIAADAACHNVVAVLVAGGGQHPPAELPTPTQAERFLDVHGRRVPLYVIALGSKPSDVAGLRELAAVSGGRYVEIPAELGLQVPNAVARVTAALNSAIQHAFARFSDVNARPTAADPLGPISEFPMTSPVVGTLDLENLVTQSGMLLPLTRVTTPAGAVIPQASNVLFTAALAVPGFEGRLRAFRVYRPQPDPSGPGGYRFVADGTPLWMATLPPPAARNIFAVVPGRGLVPFEAGQAALLAPFLRSSDASALIAAIRAHPLGAVTTSTPALLTPPALGCPEDAARAFELAHQDRRALLFVGLDDGMMHAFDARTGVEVWAVIPFNLLPKLRFLLEGQPVDGFLHFVGGSPRLSDVLIDGAWRTVLVFGEAAGGTFYQAFDVTLDGIGRAVPPTADHRLDLLGWFADPGRIPFLWSFPLYQHFDPALGEAGDVAPGASAVEKSVGQSWSTPAILGVDWGAPTLVMVGLGPLPAALQRAGNRGGTVAGTRLYLLDAGSGAILDSRDVGSDGEGEDQDSCPASGCRRFKNAVAADAVVVQAVGHDPQAYVGDLDGRLWGVRVGREDGRPRFSGVRLVFAAGPEHPLFTAVAAIPAGAGATYVFLGTGGDQLLLAADRPPARIVTLLDAPAGVSKVAELALGSLAGEGVDERLSALPAAGGDVVFFAATAVVAGGCRPAESRLYAVTISGGAAYDTTGDGRRDARDSARVATLPGGRATSPVVADRHLYLTAGDQVEVFGDPVRFNTGPGFVGVRVLSWRDVGRLPPP